MKKNTKKKQPKIIKIGKMEITKGALVELIILLVLLIGYIFSPTVYSVTTGLYNQSTKEDQKNVENAMGSENTEERFEKAMALARVNRCTTVAGALDTYAKGLIYEHGIYIATASSLSKHEELVEKMQNSGPGGTMYKIEAGEEFDTLMSNDYRIYNLEEKQDDLYEAYLVFSIYGWHDGLYNSVIVPVKVFHEDAWVVEECGERILSTQDIDGMMHSGSGIPNLATYEAVGESGTVTISVVNYCYIDNNYTNSTSLWMGTYTDDSLKVDAEFQSGYIWEFARYGYTEGTDRNEPEYSIGIKYIGLESLDDKVEFPDVALNGNGGGSDSNGFGWANQYIDEEESGYLETGGGRGNTDEDFELGIPEGYKIQLYWDGELVEELTAKRVANSTSSISEYPEIYGELSQTSVYMNKLSKVSFKASKDVEYQRGKEAGKIQKISDSELDDLLEKFMFSENWAYDEKEEFINKLAAYGIYEFETTNSKQPDIYMPYTKVMYPQLFYNANDGTWIVTCGGYCDGNGDGLTKQILPGNVGDVEIFGVRFTETTGNYDSLVLRAVANITDQGETERVETQNRSDGDSEKGFTFELQDYIYDDSLFDGKENYVGYRWYGACTYGPGFENYGGNITAVYQHTE